MKQIGEVLQHRRERMGLTLAELEKRTHIKRETLVSIEKNDFESLKYPQYAKGFIQKYAQAVNMDARALFSDHESELPTSQHYAKAALSDLHQNPNALEMAPSQKEPISLMMLIGGIIVATGIFWGVLSLVL